MIDNDMLRDTDDGTDSVQIDYGWNNDTSASQMIVEGIADFKNTTTTSLPPFYETIDPDALNKLFDPTREHIRNRGRVEFKYADCQITIGADGTILIESADPR